MVDHIYPPELQLNKANTSDTEAPFLDLRLSISYGFVSSQIYDKRDDFDIVIVNLFWKELFIRFTASAFRKLLSVNVFSYFPFGFEGRVWDLIVAYLFTFQFWMVTFPVLPLTGFSFFNLFGLLECLVMWLISMPVIKFNCQTSPTRLSVT